MTLDARADPRTRLVGPVKKNAMSLLYLYYYLYYNSNKGTS